MGVKARARAAVILLMVLLVGVSAARTGWAQSQAADVPPAERDLSGTQILATVAAAVGSFFYIPFKALGICPGMALASGVSLAANWDNPETSDFLLRIGCTGTYLITPGMIRGREEFEGSGYPEPETSVPMYGPR